MSRFLAKVVVFGWWVAKAPNFAQTLCDGFFFWGSQALSGKMDPEHSAAHSWVGVG